MTSDYIKLTVNGKTNVVFDMRFGDDKTLFRMKNNNLFSVTLKLQRLFPGAHIAQSVATRAEYADFAGLTH